MPPPSTKTPTPSAVPSMETVAAAAGVATSTVSRALKGDLRISLATRRRICELAERLGYRPNPLVSALMAQLRHAHPPTARCNLAWLDFFPGEEDWRNDPVHTAFYSGACQRARVLGYAINRIRGGGRTSSRFSRTLRNRGIQGILLPAYDSLEGLSSRISLPLEDYTIVGVGTRFEQPSLHYSSDDQYECGRLAVKQLWSLGYRRIGYVGETRIEKIVNGRFFAGYHATLQSELAGPPILPLLTNDDHEIIAWLRTVRVDALVSANRRLLTVLRSHGVRVPEDVAVAHLNVDDVEGAGPGDVAGIRQDNALVGANAVELLVSLLYQNEIGVPVHPRGIQLIGTWVDGATVRPVEPSAPGA